MCEDEHVQNNTRSPRQVEEDFAQRCAAARMRKVPRMSQHELARQLTDVGLPMQQSSVAKMEKRGAQRRPLSLAEALALSAILRVPLWHDLLWWKDDDRI